MSEENLDTQTVPEASDVSAPEGGAENITLDQLKDVLGKDFKDTETALKSVKDTFSYVGSQAQFKDRMDSLTEKLGTDEEGVLAALESLSGSKNESQPEAPKDTFISKEQYETDQFFAQNDSLNELKDILVPLKQAEPDTSWSDFMKQPTIEKVVESYQGYAEVQSKKSVLETNPRIAQAADDLTKAQEALDASRQALRTGDTVNSERAYDDARKSAIEAVMKGNNLN